MAIISVTTGGPDAFTPSGQTILKVIQDVCFVVGLAQPTAVFGSGDRAMMEIGALATEMAKRIAFDTHDWTALRATNTLTGDGTTENTPLPSDYRRMLKQTRLWSSVTPPVPLIHVTDADRWTELDVLNLTTVVPRWTLMGGQMIIKPAPPVGSTIKYVYISNEIISGPAETEFSTDAVQFVLDDRVLKLGIIWQWKANKGLPYAEDMQTYETALAYAIGEDKGPSTIVVGSRRPSRGTDHIAYPGRLGG